MINEIDWSKVDKDKILQLIKNYFIICKPYSSESVTQDDKCYQYASTYMGFIVDEVWRVQERKNED
jgi:hypothetical protein